MAKGASDLPTELINSLHLKIPESRSEINTKDFFPDLFSKRASLGLPSSCGSLSAMFYVLVSFIQSRGCNRKVNLAKSSSLECWWLTGNPVSGRIHQVGLHIFYSVYQLNNHPIADLPLNVQDIQISSMYEIST